ncbi:Alpha/Beta hydrolase protein [Aspergillus falconensis]
MSSLFLSTSLDTSLHIRISRPSTASSKPLLVFLHYWGGSSSTWYKLTATDSKASVSSRYPTAAVDLRGWGKSTGPAIDPGSVYSITAMAGDIASVLSQLEEDDDSKDLLAHGFVLVGHSMGAKIALAAQSMLPAHLLEQLHGFVLIAPAPPTELILPASMQQQQKAAYETEGSVRWTVENILANANHLLEKDLELVVRDSLSGNPQAKTAWPLYGMKQDISQLVTKSSPARNVRIRVLAGELDVVEPKERIKAEVCDFLTGLGADVSFRTVEGVKHLIPLESPEAVRDEILVF